MTIVHAWISRELYELRSQTYCAMRNRFGILLLFFFFARQMLEGKMINECSEEAAEFHFNIFYYVSRIVHGAV